MVLLLRTTRPLFLHWPQHTQQERMPCPLLLPTMAGAHPSRVSAQPRFKVPLDPRVRQLHGECQSHKMRPVRSNPSLHLNHKMRSDAGDGCHGYLWVTQPGQRPGTPILLKGLIQLVETGGTRLSEQLLSLVLLFSSDGAKWSPELPAASPSPASLRDGVNLCLHPAHCISLTGIRHLIVHVTIHCAWGLSRGCLLSLPYSVNGARADDSRPARSVNPRSTCSCHHLNLSDLRGRASQAQEEGEIFSLHPKKNTTVCTFFVYQLATYGESRAH